MTRFLMRGAAALLAVAPWAPAWADHPIAGGGASHSGPILTIGAETLAAGQLAAALRAAVAVPDAYSDTELIAFAAKHTHAHTTDYNAALAASLAYGVTGHLTVSASLPFIRRDDLREGAHSHHGGTVSNTVEPLGSVTGVGDVSLLGQYVLAHSHEQGWWISALAGLKLPTGETGETDPAGNRLETEHQPGTGSWDPLFGLAAQKAWGPAALHASAFYQLAGEGAQDTRLGDRLNLAAAGVYTLSGSSDPSVLDGRPVWGVMVEASYEWEGRQVVAGVIDGDSGGKALWLSPGVRFTSPTGWSAALSAGVPLWQDIGVSHPDNAVRVTAQVGTVF